MDIAEDDQKTKLHIGSTRLLTEEDFNRLSELREREAQKPSRKRCRCALDSLLLRVHVC